MARLLLVSFLTVAAAVMVPPTRTASARRALAVTVDSLKTGHVIPAAYTYCVPAPLGHTATGPNRSPAITWSHGPAGTKSYAVVIVDTDVPTVLTDADKEGRTIPASLPRRPFYHFLLVDIPRTTTGLPEGADSTGPSPKRPGPTRYGVRGLNDYGGGRAGYDGPCPPWNDSIVHHYHFQVYALDGARLALPTPFKGPDVVRAMRGHVLARGEVVGLYTQNPDVAKTLGR